MSMMSIYIHKCCHEALSFLIPRILILVIQGEIERYVSILPIDHLDSNSKHFVFIEIEIL